MLKLATRALTDLHIIDSMHERKAMMYDVADAFIIFQVDLERLMKPWKSSHGVN